MPARGYVLNSTLVVSGTVAVSCHGEWCCAAVPTGDGVTSGGSVPEGSNNALLILNDTSTTSNDNDTSTDCVAGGTEKHPSYSNIIVIHNNACPCSL